MKQNIKTFIQQNTFESFSKVQSAVNKFIKFFQSNIQGKNAMFNVSILAKKFTNAWLY